MVPINRLHLHFQNPTWAQTDMVKPMRILLTFYINALEALEAEACDYGKRHYISNTLEVSGQSQRTGSERRGYAEISAFQSDWE